MPDMLLPSILNNYAPLAGSQAAFHGHCTINGDQLAAEMALPTVLGGSEIPLSFQFYRLYFPQRL
jgi:hypothetical protein